MYMIRRKIFFGIIALIGSVVPFLYSIEHIQMFDITRKNRLFAEQDIVVVYVYKTSPCPHVERMLHELETTVDNTIVIVLARIAEELFFPEHFMQFPTILFVHKGFIQHRTPGKPTLEQIRRYLIQS
jgi:hypothetical protein